MSYGDYAHCPACDAKLVYIEVDWPEGVEAWHESCLAASRSAHDADHVSVSREDIRAVVRLARMSRHLSEDPATDRLAEAAGEGATP